MGLWVDLLRQSGWNLLWSIIKSPVLMARNRNHYWRVCSANFAVNHCMPEELNENVVEYFQNCPTADQPRGCGLVGPNGLNMGPSKAKHKMRREMRFY